MRLRRPPAALIWPGLPLLYLLLPGHPDALLGGVPLGSLALGAGLVLGLAAWCGARPAAGAARQLALGLAVASGLKLGLVALALPYGLTAEYRADGNPGTPVERSTEWRIEGATRVDRTPSLSGDAFPVSFFNDLRRFNYFRPSEPRRDLLPFAVTWRGWLVVPRNGPACVQLNANGTASLRLGDRAPISIDQAQHVEQRESCGDRSAGSLPIELRFSRPPDGVPYLLLAESSPGDGGAEIAAERFLRAPVEAAAWARDRWTGRAAQGLDLLVVVGSLLAVAAPLVSGGAWRQARLERPLLSLALVASLAEGLAMQRHFAGRTPILSGGNDWLAYESYARDIGFNGLLMTGGKPLGEGEPFYYQPFYAYFLAGLHALLGESVSGLLVAQYVLVAAAGVVVYCLAKELFGRPAAVAAFGLFWALRYFIFNQVAGLLLSENLAALLIPGFLLLLARWQRTWRWSDLLGAAGLLGLAVLTRTTPLLALPPTMLAVAVAQRRKFGLWRPALGAATALLVVTVAIFSLAALRNSVVAGRVAFLPESTSTNIYEVHRPSPKVNLSRVDRDPLYNRLGFDRRTREVAEFIRQDPLGYAATLVPQGLYAIGFTGPALGTSQVQYELVVLTALYLAGLLVIPAARRAPAWPLHAFVGTHFLQMMVFMAQQYGFRLPLPMYGPMVAVAGAAVAALGTRLVGVRLAARSSGQRWAVGGLVAAAALWSGAQVSTPRRPEGDVFGLGGSAGPAARAVRDTAGTWAADRIYFSGLDQRSFGVAYLPGLAYREMKWVDSDRATVWPAPNRAGVFVFIPSDPASIPSLACWNGQRGPGGSGALERAERGMIWLPALGEGVCPGPGRRLASFGGLVDILRASSGDEGRVLSVAWQVVQRPGVAVQPVVEVLDERGTVVESRVADPYPSGSWEPGELVVAQLPVPTTERLRPGFKLALGFTRGSREARLAIDDPLPLYGQTRLMSDD